jgi:hypothetical protein
MKMETFNHRSKQETEQFQAIDLFTQIRDVPYALGADGDIESILADNQGGCTRKHMYLMPKLKKLGYRVELGISQFDWRNLPIPPKILELLKQPIQYHMFLYVNDVEVDATWDVGMKHLGFPVYEWDGRLATGLTIIGENPKKRNFTILKCRSVASSVLKQISGKSTEITPFNNALNQWLSNNRK